MERGKTTHTFNQNLNKQGQLSIFLGIALIVVISMMAFVINVGLFVKAKINLQNAVDASAWSGAAVQARQLANIAHLNWEMRNTFKEWMFKYYVLGQLGLEKIRGDNVFPGGSMDYTLRQFNAASPKDKYNIPSICIHFGSQHNICGIYSIPGLPRFNTQGIPAITDLQENLLDALSKTKAENCSIRTDLNFATAMIWAYGTKKDIFKDSPTIASHRTGAWIEAFELALRVRNIEMMINRPPVDSICLGGAGCTTITQLESGQRELVAVNERPLKAFMTGYRNLSGGTNKDNENDEFASSFRLAELRPKPLQVNSFDLSGFLIPEGSDIAGSGVSALEKHYVDLQINPVNYSTFFSAFISSAKDSGAVSGVASDAACGVTKTALPVPGYPLGFTKNPEVLTYYAVKGSAKFLGLFYPFKDTSGIELKAYAAAKPFGGRIGPRLFNVADPRSIEPRKAGIKKSSSYIGAIEVGVGATFTQEDPLPLTRFWATNSSNVGGTPQAGVEATFGFPNLVYDLSGNMAAQVNSASATNLLFIKSGNTTVPQLGLYDSDQFRSFSSNLQAGAQTGVVSSDLIDQTLQNVRSPTNYEALNYLIPTFESNASGLTDPNDEKMESISSASPIPGAIHPRTGAEFYALYGPLYGQGTLYQNIDAIKGVAYEYLQNITPAVEAFTDALKEASDDIRSQRGKGLNLSGGTNDEIYKQAAATIHPGGGDLIVTDANCNSLSIAHKFHHFILMDREECDIKPLSQNLSEYMDTQTSSSTGIPYQFFYKTSYLPNPNLPNSKLATGYMPGPRQGALRDGTLPHPFNKAEPVIAKRNHYSVKHIAMEKLTSNAKGIGYGAGDFPIFLDGSSENDSILELSNSNVPISETRNRNILNAQQLEEFGDLTH